MPALARAKKRGAEKAKKTYNNHIIKPPKQLCPSICCPEHKQGAAAGKSRKRARRSGARRSRDEDGRKAGEEMFSNEIPARRLFF